MLKFSRPDLVYAVFVAPEQTLFRGNFVSRLCRAFSLVWVLRLGVLSLGVWGVAFLLVLVQCLGKYYSYVGRQISPSLSIGARARFM